jgi:hypothetical protein
MESMHQHTFKNWPFDCPDDVGCLTTRQVMEQGFPILAILHDKDGSWQVLCDSTEDPKDGMIVCLGCLLERFPIIEEHARLLPGYEAVRSSEHSPWPVHKTEYHAQ